MSLKPLNHHYAMENPASVYDEEAMTALELAGRTTAKVNECVSAFNLLKTETEKHLEDQDNAIPVKVEKAVQEHIDNGTFDKQVDKYAGNLKKQIEDVDRDLTRDITDTAYQLNARINGLSTLTGGSTTGDAELVDARTSDLGTTHANVGAVIRTNLDLIRKNGKNRFTVENDFYNQFRAQDLTGKVATNRVSLVKPITTDRLLTVKCQEGYEISISCWKSWTVGAVNDPANNYYSDTGWVREWCLSPGHNYMISLRKGDDLPICVDECYAVEIVEPYWEGQVFGNILDYILPGFVHGSINTAAKPYYYLYTSHDRFVSQFFTAGKPFTLYTTGDCYVGLHVWKESGNILIDNLVKDTGWYQEILVPENVPCTLYFKDDSAPKDNYGYPLMLPESLKHLHYRPQSEVNADLTGHVNRANLGGKIRTIAHRGYSNYGTHAPENTLPAYKLAKKMGFDYAECDVRVTSDGYPVLLHDETIDRTSNGSGKISEMTYSGVTSYDFGNEAYPNTPIPLFEDFIKLCKQINLHPYIELEPGTENYAEKIYGIVKKYGMENACTWVSFYTPLLQGILNIDPASRVGYIVNTVDVETVSIAKTLKTPYNDVFVSVGVLNGVTAELIAGLDTCVNGEMPVEVWCPNDAETILALPDYVQGITTEDVDAGKIIYDKAMEGV